MEQTQTRRPIDWKSPTMWAFLAVMAIGLTVIILAIVGTLQATWQHWVYGLILAYARGFFIAAGYHRYFSHRSFEFRAPRVTQFLFAFLACTAVQKGPLWWASTHRVHHRYTDKKGDPHSPALDGFWQSHMGWVMSNEKEAKIPDFAQYPELRWLDRWHYLPAVILVLICYALGGLAGLLVFCASTAFLWHCTFLVNSAAHLFGPRRYETPDTSRNCWLITPFVLGEQWHNNHHARQGLVRQGEKWWEFDPAFYIIWLLQFVGVTKNLRYANTKT